MADVPKWFSGLKLNYAENMLRFNDDRVALISEGVCVCAYVRVCMYVCMYVRVHLFVT